jgi:hypothetical protein
MPFDMSDSKLLISHHLVAVAAKAAQIDSTCSVRIRPTIARRSGPARGVGAREYRNSGHWAIEFQRSDGRESWAVRYGANCEVAASDRLWPRVAVARSPPFADVARGRRWRYA